MSKSFSLPDSLSLRDLQVYLSRAGRVEDGSVRLIQAAGVLAVYTAILYPRGLLDSSPTVLGLRTFALTAPVDLDAVVPVRSLLDRLARLTAAVSEPEAAVTVTVPLEVTTVTWAGISPPTGGWTLLGQTDAALLEGAAKTGIEEVAAVIPSGTGAQIVQRVRSEVWSRPIPGLEIVPSGAAFAAVSLGFLAKDEPVRLYETGLWTRMSTSRGHILVRRKSWSLQA
ncbi:hypothetical protein E3T26_03570 [Cryobacterium sp. TMT1-21]|uniref:Uncharacterized protein n=1 Tax=Cryobacterium shii TaxID=1259235 RepID=A0AAQ2C7K5_9MICO|nr:MULTISPECIES: hypothetical protein [Cryobacterium]TFC49822.1 hypothetical protein E3O49_05635 [Cryobacterium shii]TFC86026.1 hypothetical protein E3T24_07520 [Cryobacterium sp. TmT2-59]TFD13767.1 hypothetical protein E3T42_14025 [Cryobacterium sp. TMT4-10]TFD16726.1 hypothetical protein E3T26_03570 [Cryobacterium sp. TMT1-21]TFD38537.1 hypothetical protein E3T37_09580 [Cryobacterium sp. TMT2-10]